MLELCNGRVAAAEEVQQSCASQFVYKLLLAFKRWQYWAADDDNRITDRRRHTEMADTELNVDSIISRLLEGIFI
jgi:hypothetical protein